MGKTMQRDVRHSIIHFQLDFSKNVAKNEVQLTPRKASHTGISNAFMEKGFRLLILTYLIPKQLRGPLEKATRYLSRFCEPD